MKKKTDLLSGYFRDSLRAFFNLSHFRLGPSLFSAVAFIITILVVVAKMNSGAEGAGDLRDFETGKVADRDVIADQPVSYVDEDATRLRMEAQEQLVPAVFRYSTAANTDMKNAWNGFSDFADNLVKEGFSPEALRLKIQDIYPAYFSVEAINAYFAAPDRDAFRDYGLKVLDTVQGKGVFALHRAELQNYNPDIAELLTASGSRTERERVSYGSVLTKENAAEGVSHAAAAADLPESFSDIAADLLKPFIIENVLFSPDDTGQRVAEARVRLVPVVKYIDKGKRIIRKGFLITDEDMRELRALNMSLPGRDPRSVIGLVLLMLLVYMLFIFIRGGVLLGRELSNPESYILSTLVSFYLIGAVLVKNASFGVEAFPVSMLLPTALMVMLPAILIGHRLALVLALALPLGAYLSGSFDTSAYIFALVSAVVASIVLKNAAKRMDLIKAGGIIALANCIAVVVVLLIRRTGPGAYPSMLFWAAFNGIVSGMLVLGFLPPLEHALNAATTFRLMELSDLNAPILKRLFTAAPGTYSHSIMVANLAEQACQDIGANALLARVGAYYHDIGKMENPDYFVENQTVYNKHDDIAPRLSATVIRSHVKFGLEKARQLNLPQEVIDIIAEHHGNSLITWFYNKASQQEAQVNMEDFAYPGVPPRSRESAVVMLADVTEAAVRTLSKPTAAKMEKFIQQLFDAKMAHGQLSQCELTFRDLETIKNAFVKVLASYYHSRIEYPKEPVKELVKEPVPLKGNLAAKEDEE